MADRQKSGVPADDIQSGDGNRDDEDTRELPHAKRRALRHEEQGTDGSHQQNQLEYPVRRRSGNHHTRLPDCLFGDRGFISLGKRRHTRSSFLVPNSPLGLTKRITTMISSADVCCSEPLMTEM